MGATETLARWIVNARYKDMPDAAKRVANEACFDCTGVMLAGAQQPLGRIITRYVDDMGGTPEATVVASGIRSSAPNVALANGALGHALDFDDMGGFGHPTTVIYPALLALGEKLGKTGKDLLEAYIVGVETGVNLTGGGMEHGRYNQMKRGFHSTAIFGRMAATAACSHLMGLNVEQTVNALSVASSMAGGAIANFGTMTKPLHAGMVARDGVMAAELAADGWVSGPRAVEHPLGFVQTFYGEDMANADDLVANLGNPYHTQEAIIIKKYPCCGGNHSMLDGLLGLLKEHKLTYDQIETVEIVQPYLSVVMLYGEPEEGLTGKFSILYNAALAILDQKVAIGSFMDEKALSSQMKEAMDKVRIIVEDKWSPGSQRVFSGTPVAVRTKDGKTYKAQVEFSMIKGSQKNPWGFDNVADKFRDCARFSLPRNRVESALNAWKDIASIKDLGKAMRAVTVS